MSVASQAQVFLGAMAVVIGAPAATALADDEPAGSSPFVATIRQGDGTVRVGGAVEQQRERRQSTRSASETVIVYSYAAQCGTEGLVLLGGSGRCSKVSCTTADGRAGERFTVITRRVERASYEPVSEPNIAGITCRATEARPMVDLETLVLRQFRSLELPGLTVRTNPPDRTFVHLPTTFSVDPPPKNHEVRPIFGRRVTIVVRPVSYRWSFGDGTVRTTKARGNGAPDSSVTHAFTAPMNASVSVRTTYRARFRVDGGEQREIAGAVPVEGAVTTLRVEEAESELIAGPR